MSARKLEISLEDANAILEELDDGALREWLRVRVLIAEREQKSDDSWVSAP